jgi:hypothetical protein
MKGKLFKFDDDHLLSFEEAVEITMYEFEKGDGLTITREEAKDLILAGVAEGNLIYFTRDDETGEVTEHMNPKPKKFPRTQEVVQKIAIRNLELISKMHKDKETQ